LAASSVYFQDPDHRDDYRRIAAEQPSLLLKGERPVLLDEWQDAPQIWDAVRFAVDRGHDMGMFLLTGSSVPGPEEIRHTGTGRFARIVMRPMSLFESADSSGEVALRSIIDGDSIYAASRGGLESVARLIARGGWPVSVTRDDEFGQARARDYVTSIVDSDISRIDGVDKNPRRVQRLMRSLARNESTNAAMTTLQGDMVADDSSLSTNTIGVYLAALRRLYVIEDQEAWPMAVRSKTVIRTSAKRRYCDPSIPAALLDLTPAKMLVDFNTFGLLFYSLCVRDLRVYAEAIGARVFYYRDGRDLEADAIIELPDGRWGAVEVKLESTREDEAARTLLDIKRLVRSQHGGEASFLMVVTANGIAHRRADGVCVVPITCLKP